MYDIDENALNCRYMICRLLRDTSNQLPETTRSHEICTIEIYTIGLSLCLQLVYSGKKS